MKRLGLKEVDGRGVVPAGAESRETAAPLETEEAASVSSPGQDSGLVSAEDDNKVRSTGPSDRELS